MLDEPFEEHEITLNKPETKSTILHISAAGKVPVLQDKSVQIWDSLAICEYLAECFPAARLWPDSAELRAEARSMVAEMHSGFQALRQHLPFDANHTVTGFIPTAETQSDIDRIVSLWEKRRSAEQANGGFLFGHFTIADAFFAPVVWRLKSYDIKLPLLSSQYVEHILALPAMQQWLNAGKI